ncbi:YchJ family protein [Pedobacter sp. ASV28]|uniref:YchJ family protein n=1 Tax=Pedobacter sp. ASV28 TaxID=2795123 RepID=UPI0018EE2330|nr:YchJ family metal-binding protein [Pedobacter sp. ASV28]
MTVLLCACCSGLNYQECCAPYHRNIINPETPEQLMRSRYSAYVLFLIDYLIQTTHPAKRHLHAKKDIAHWAKRSVWLKLEVCTAYNEMVEFKAYYQNGLKTIIHHELSTFKKQHGIWYYFSGEHIGL